MICCAESTPNPGISATRATAFSWGLSAVAMSGSSLSMCWSNKVRRSRYSFSSSRWAGSTEPGQGIGEFLFAAL